MGGRNAFLISYFFGFSRLDFPVQFPLGGELFNSEIVPCNVCCKEVFEDLFFKRGRSIAAHACSIPWCFVVSAMLSFVVSPLVAAKVTNKRTATNSTTALPALFSANVSSLLRGATYHARDLFSKDTGANGTIFNTASLLPFILS